MQAKYNNPEERAKWEKLAREAEASANSPERKAMIIRLQKDAALHVAEAQKMMASAEFKKAMQIRINQNIPIMIMSDNSTDQKVKQSPEYIKLKQKFDKDVEDLNKKLKKDSN
jgi:bla regulator protein BlaR1